MELQGQGMPIEASPENIINHLRARLADEIVGRAVTEAALWEAQQELMQLRQLEQEKKVE